MMRNTLIVTVLLAIVVSISIAGPAQPQEAQDAPEAPAPNTGDTAVEATVEQIKPTLPAEWMDSFQWRSIGPAVMGGRITDIAVDPSDPSTYWISSASGGLLKTTNNGITFEHQFTDQSTVSIGAVAVAPSAPDVLWVGTGESNPRNSVSWGDGVYKSVDGGATFAHMGLRESFQIGSIVIDPSNENVVYVAALGRLWGPNEERGLFKTEDGGETWNKVLYVDENTGVIDVQMHPTDPYTLIAATYERRRDGFDSNDPAQKLGEGSGLYKTTDGGENFTQVTEGLPSVKLGRIGLDFYRADPNIVYAVVETELIAQEPENAAYLGTRGENADVGARLTEVTEESPAAEAGLEVGDIVIGVEGETVHSYNDFQAAIRSRLAGDTIALEVSRDRESVEFEVTFSKRPGAEEDDEASEGGERRGGGGARGGGGGGGRGGGQRSPFSSGLGGQVENVQDQQGPDGTDFGGVYKSEDAGDTWKRINSVNPRPMYYSQIRVDPSDSNHLYVLGTSLYRSKDGGETFTGDGGRGGVHVDHHAMWVDPDDGRHIILGNDGGLYVTYDRMENWDHHNHFAIGQFYHVTVGPNRNYRVYGGLQDNGSWGGPSRTRSGGGPVNSDWFRVGGGDGFICLVDAEDADQVYYESQGGGFGTRNLRTGEQGSARPRAPRGTRYRFNWKSPFILSNHNSRIYYNAGNYVFKSLQRGEDLRRISPEITLTDRGAATALTESPIDPDVLYVGTNDGALWVTTDGGGEWTPLIDKPEGEDAPEEADVQIAAGEGGGSDGAGRGGGGRRGGGRGGMVNMIRSLDANGDGKIQRAEVPDRMEQMFGRLDANDDGVIDAEELQAASQRMRARRDDPPTDPPTEQVNGSNGANGDHDNGDESAPAPQDATEATEQDAEESSDVQDEAKTESDQATDADAPPATDAQEPLAEAENPEAAQETPADPTEAAPAADDPLTGVWAVTGSGDFGGFEFTLVFKLGEDGKSVTGEFDSQFQTGDISGGTYNAETRKLRCNYGGEIMNGEITATIAEDGTMSGTLLSGRGFEIEWEARRISRSTDASAAEEEEERPDDGYDWQPINGLLPGPRWVSSLEASRFAAGRCYVTFDAHRSNDDEPYVFVTEDHGETWRPIRANLPTTAGTTRVIREDLYNENLLYLGCEFSAWVSIDRGQSWTPLNSNLPTVAVHEIAIHPTAGEIVAGTHGRSLWVLDVAALRQMNAEVVDADAHLFRPGDAVIWRGEPSTGGTLRQFRGQNPASGALIYYSLGTNARGVSLKVTDQAGETVREFEANGQAGLHRMSWDLRRVTPQAQGQQRGQRGRGGGRFRRGRPVETGQYLVVLEVNGQQYSQRLNVINDPDYPDMPAEAAYDEFDEDVEEGVVEPLDRID